MVHVSQQTPSLPAKPSGMNYAKTQGYELCTSIYDIHKLPFLNHMESFLQRPVYKYPLEFSSMVLLYLQQNSFLLRTIPRQNKTEDN
jgi:hypothetical protein